VPVLEQARIAGGWAGLRPLTPDDHAIIGWAPGVSGFFLAVGFGGHGFQHSPATGHHVAAWILDGTPAMDLSLFDPSRFAGGRGDAAAPAGNAATPASLRPPTAEGDTTLRYNA
jgi:sarcosine oxidase subunit beta